MNIKDKLDSLLEKHLAQPVGHGYIDIIVSRDLYKSFAKDVLELGINIKSISWWEYIESQDEEGKYGLGGPTSKFFPGWFSELTIDVDDIDIYETYTLKLDVIVDLIENKEIEFADGEKISYKKHKFLTPAFWLEVPNNWRNNFQNQK